MCILGRVLLSTLLPVFLIGCDSGEPPKSSGKYDSLIADVNETQVRIERRYLLRQVSVQERLYYVQGLTLIQNGFSILNKDPNSKPAVKMIDRGVALLRRYENLERDQSVIRSLLQKVGGAVVPVADRLKLELSQRWIVWVTEFSDDTLANSGFLMFPEGTWSSKLVINGLRQIAIFRSNAFTNYIPHSWLVLPAMDLRNVRKPAIRLEHGIKIGQAGSNPFDQRLFQLKSFKIKVSTTFEGGIDKPWEMRDCKMVPSGEGGLRMQVLGEECDWMTYDTNATEMLTNDFYATFTPVIPLDEYREENVTIAFVIDQTPLRYDPFSCEGHYLASTCRVKLCEPVELQKHFVDWELRSFELLGMGQVEFPEGMRVEPQTLFEHSFASPEVVDHVVLDDPVQNESAVFAPAGRGRDADPEWILATSRPDRPASTGVVSPIFDVSKSQKLKFGMRETIRFNFDDKSQRTLAPYQVLYSYDFEGGDVVQATWKLVPRSKSADEYELNSWNSNQVSNIKIPESPSGRVTFLFWYKSDLDMLWQILGYDLKGEGEALTRLEYQFPPSISGPWEDILPEDGGEAPIGECR